MHQIVEDMLVAQRNERDLDLKVNEEMQKLPPCEIRGHQDGGRDHDPEKPAEFWAISPCGLEKLACAKWVRMGSLTPATDCIYCGHQHSNHEYTYIPLDIRQD